jgi:hypothetical protein
LFTLHKRSIKIIYHLINSLIHRNPMTDCTFNIFNIKILLMIMIDIIIFIIRALW